MSSKWNHWRIIKTKDQRQLSEHYKQQRMWTIAAYFYSTTSSKRATCPYETSPMTMCYHQRQQLSVTIIRTAPPYNQWPINNIINNLYIPSIPHDRTPPLLRRIVSFIRPKLITNRTQHRNSIQTAPQYRRKQRHKSNYSIIQTVAAWTKPNKNQKDTGNKKTNRDTIEPR